MKRFGLTIIICMVLLLVLPLLSYAQESIIEMPDVKVIINGERVELEDVPLCINDRTLLPLRDVLNGLGVEDDNGHIIWDEASKSVTIKKNTVTILLQVDSKTAYINDEPVVLDTPPVIYEKNDRTYIPVRFVSQAVGKKVAWDGAAKTVFIRDEEGYNAVSEIIDKTNKAMDTVVRAVVNTAMDMKVELEDGDMDFNINAVTQVDRTDGMMFSRIEMPFIDGNFDFRVFYSNNTEYLYNSKTEKWSKRAMTEKSFGQMLNDSMNTAVINSYDILCAGLKIKASSDDEIVLEGSIYPKNILDTVYEESPVENMHFDEYGIEMFIDRDTNLMKSFNVIMNGEITLGEASAAVKSVARSEYTDLNGDLTIAVPEELK